MTATFRAGSIGIIPHPIARLLYGSWVDKARCPMTTAIPNIGADHTQITRSTSLTRHDSILGHRLKPDTEVIGIGIAL
jgi:hypothetical protein